MCDSSIVKIKILRDCVMPVEVLLHPGEGCSCSKMVPGSFSEGEIIEEYEWLCGKLDFSGLKYREDYDIIEYP